MTAETDASSDRSYREDEESPNDELDRAIEEFDEAETPTEDEVREAFLS